MPHKWIPDKMKPSPLRGLFYGEKHVSVGRDLNLMQGEITSSISNEAGNRFIFAK